MNGSESETSISTRFRSDGCSNCRTFGKPRHQNSYARYRSERINGRRKSKRTYTRGQTYSEQNCRNEQTTVTQAKPISHYVRKKFGLNRNWQFRRRPHKTSRSRLDYRSSRRKFTSEKRSL